MLSFQVIHAKMPDGDQHYVTYMTPEQITRIGSLRSEAIIGVLQKPWVVGAPITSDLFARNPGFVEFLHKVIASRAPSAAGLIAEAKRQGTGTVCIIDLRTPNPKAGVPLEDIIGAFTVKKGVIESYQFNPDHRLLTENGFFQLNEVLQGFLLEEAAKLR